jgi:hypothetical protein
MRAEGCNRAARPAPTRVLCTRKASKKPASVYAKMKAFVVFLLFGLVSVVQSQFLQEVALGRNVTLNCTSNANVVWEIVGSVDQSPIVIYLTVPPVAQERGFVLEIPPDRNVKRLQVLGTSGEARRGERVGGGVLSTETETGVGGAILSH